jgi:hypothetical protein
MDETLWNKSKTLVMFDSAGNRYPVRIGTG